MCTRMPVKVRLRRGNQAMPRLLTRTLSTGKVKERSIPFVRGLEGVQEAMQHAVEMEQGNGRGICQDHVLELYLTSPTMPNLDLLDLPGIVSSFSKLLLVY